MPLPHGFRDWLTKESQRWHQDGLLAPDQRERILALYPEEETGSGRLAFALRTFGVLLLGAALLLVISHNWADLSRTGRLVTVVAGLIGLQGIGLWYSLRAKATGSVLGHLAGCIMFGAAIALTGQIYHLDAHSPDAILAWCLGTLPFALLLDSALLHIGTVILAGIWLIMETGDGVFGHRSIHLEAYRLAFYALILPTAVAAYRNPRPILAGAVAWACAFAWFQFWGKLPVELFVLPLAIAALHSPGNPLARGWRFIGGLGVTIITLILGNLNRSYSEKFFQYEPVTTVVVLLIAGVALVRGLLRKEPQCTWPALIAVSTLAVGFLHNLIPMTGSLAWTWTVLKALSNATTLALAIWLLRLGLSEGRLRPYVYGSLVFLAWLITRYVDLGRSLSMLTLAGFFAVIGVILFILARVWRSQKDTAVTETMEPFAPLWLNGVVLGLRPFVAPLLVAATAAQVIVIGVMVYRHQQPLDKGARFMLRCQPVDPRDLLKGDYVILSYEFSRFTPADQQRLGDEWVKLNPSSDFASQNRALYGRIPNDTPVYVPLRLDAHGHAIAGDVTLLKPPTGPFLRGLTGRGNWSFNSARFGIEAYYVEEGKGREWELLRNQGHLLAEVAILPDGRAGLVSIRKSNPGDAKSVMFRKLENYSFNPEGYRNGHLIRDAKAFATSFRPKSSEGAAPTTPDFSREMVVAYVESETLSSKEMTILRVEQIGRTLVVTVQTLFGQKQGERTRPQVAAIVEASNPRTIEFRDERGSLLHRIEP